MALESEPSGSPRPSREDILERVRGIVVWASGDQRAPHKPLLMLYALGRLQAGADRMVEYREIDESLGSLLTDFGPPRKSVHPEYPFWRLQRDGLWVVPDAGHLRVREGNTDPLKSELLAHHVKGGFPPEVQELLERDADLRRDVVLEILHEHFPPSIHEELLEAVGLEAEWALAPVRSRTAGRTTRRPRRAGFRTEVLDAYGEACAVCGFDVQLASRPFGLDAAHIRWHQANGPDTVTNGLALCALHHRALDRGVIGIDDGLRILISPRVGGACGLESSFLTFAGAELRQPHSASLAPDAEHVAWHRREVFHGTTP